MAISIGERTLGEENTDVASWIGNRAILLAIQVSSGAIDAAIHPIHLYAATFENDRWGALRYKR